MDFAFARSRIRFAASLRYLFRRLAEKQNNKFVIELLLFRYILTGGGGDGWLLSSPSFSKRKEHRPSFHPPFRARRERQLGQQGRRRDVARVRPSNMSSLSLTWTYQGRIYVIWTVALTGRSRAL